MRSVPARGSATPRSVATAETRRAGVTSNAGLKPRDPSGASRVPARTVTSSPARSSISMPDAVGHRQVDGRPRRRDHERDPGVGAGERDPEGADLVGGVAVGGDPVGADDGEVDEPAQDRRGRRAVGLDDVRDAVGGQLEGGEPRALEQRPGLVGVDELDAVAGVQLTDDAEARPPRRGREGAGVAVREDAQPRPVDPGRGASRRRAGTARGWRPRRRGRPRGPRPARRRAPAPMSGRTWSTPQARLTAVGRACRTRSTASWTWASTPALARALVHRDDDAHRARHPERRRTPHGELGDRGDEVLGAVDGAEGRRARAGGSGRGGGPPRARRTRRCRPTRWR